MLKNPNTNCNKQCIFSESMRASTLVHYAPIYDKNGNNTNADGNITTWFINCDTCGKKWKAKQQYQYLTYDEIN